MIIVTYNIFYLIYKYINFTLKKLKIVCVNIFINLTLEKIN